MPTGREKSSLSRDEKVKTWLISGSREWGISRLQYNSGPCTIPCHGTITDQLNRAPTGGQIQWNVLPCQTMPVARWSNSMWLRWLGWNCLSQYLSHLVSSSCFSPLHLLLALTSLRRSPPSGTYMLQSQPLSLISVPVTHCTVHPSCLPPIPLPASTLLS